MLEIRTGKGLGGRETPLSFAWPPKALVALRGIWMPWSAPQHDRAAGNTTVPFKNFSGEYEGSLLFSDTYGAVR